jgi:hypothetical protein
MFKRAIGFVQESGFIGGITNFNFMTNEVTLVDDEAVETVHNVADVEVLFEAFELHGITVFNKDVLGAINGKRYLVELHEDGKIQLHQLDDNLETVASGEKFDANGTVVSQLESVMDLQGNLYELLAELPQTPDFNVKIVKHYDGQHFTYYYACNNKEVEQIDLIKVLYLGHQLLEEEDYERNTISHEDYVSRIEDGNLVEVTPQELHNFVLGASYGRTQEVQVCCDIEDEEDVELLEDVCEDTCEEEDGTCDDCGRQTEDCDCDLWN